MDSENLFNAIIQTISRWSSRGEKLLPNGTRLICPTPNIAPDAWLHVVFSPLAPEKIKEVEKKLGTTLPGDFKGFLLRTNGLMLFSCHIDIWGARETMARTGDDVWQPYDLVDHNFKTERPDGSPDNAVFFGSTDNGDSWSFFEFAGKRYRVGKTARNNFHPVSYWADFNSWLLDESKSLERLFDSRGVRIAA
jgi:hypothetical protein